MSKFLKNFKKFCQIFFSPFFFFWFRGFRIWVETWRVHVLRQNSRMSQINSCCDTSLLPLPVCSPPPLTTMGLAAAGNIREARSTFSLPKTKWWALLEKAGVMKSLPCSPVWLLLHLLDTPQEGWTVTSKVHPRPLLGNTRQQPPQWRTKEWYHHSCLLKRGCALGWPCRGERSWGERREWVFFTPSLHWLLPPSPTGHFRPWDAWLGLFRVGLGCVWWMRPYSGWEPGDLIIPTLPYSVWVKPWISLVQLDPLWLSMPNQQCFFFRPQYLELLTIDVRSWSQDLLHTVHSVLLYHSVMVLLPRQANRRGLLILCCPAE